MPLSITDQTNPHNWWRILRYEQSEFGEGETNVSAKWARLCRVSWEKGARQIRTQ